MIKKVILWILRKLNLMPSPTILYRTKIIIIKRPENDNKNYSQSELFYLMSLKPEYPNEKIAKEMGRTEAAIRQIRWRIKRGLI